jgi:hypothetical protein
MRAPHLLIVALNLTVIACQGRGSPNVRDTTDVQQAADSPATASRGSEPAPTTSSTSSGSAGITPSEPGTVPATPTPTVTTENAIATMRLNLQRMDTASVQDLQARMREHSKSIGDLLTTMRVEVQAATSPSKNAWLASADSVESDLDRLALAQGEELKTAFRAHRNRVLRLIEAFRVLVPAK